MKQIGWLGSQLSQQRLHGMSFFHVYSKQNSITVWIWSVIAKGLAKSIYCAGTNAAASSQKGYQVFLGWWERERGKANNTKKYYWNMAWSSFQSTEAHNFAMQKLQSVAREVPIQRIPDGTRKLISCASQPLNSTSRVKKKGDSQLLSGRITIICWCKNVTGAAMAIATIYKLHSEVFQLR